MEGQLVVNHAAASTASQSESSHSATNGHHQWPFGRPAPCAEQETQLPALEPPSAWLMLPLLEHRGLPATRENSGQPKQSLSAWKCQMWCVWKFDTVYFVTVDINILWNGVSSLEWDGSCISLCEKWLHRAGGVGLDNESIAAVRKCWDAVVTNNMGNLPIGNFWRLPA